MHHSRALQQRYSELQPQRDFRGHTLDLSPRANSDFDYAGFSVSGTNDTILNAGRNNPVIAPLSAPETYPTYTFTQF